VRVGVLLHPTDQAPTGQSDEEQRHDRTDGEREGNHDGFKVDVARRTQYGDRGEHRSGTRHEHQTQRQTDNETAARTTRLASTSLANGRSSHSPITGMTKPIPTRRGGHADPHQRVLREIQSRQNFRSDEHQETETEDQAKDDRHRTTPRTLRSLLGTGAATPATKTIGRTGKMQGDIPAISPAASATTMSVTSDS